MRKQVKTNGIQLSVIQEGHANGPLVILLHGFPEFSYSWRKQVPALASAGYRVWAPDQRGYNLSDKPAGIEAYSLDELAADVIGLIDAAGVQQAVIVGHDWGASVAWWIAGKYPERISKMVVMNVPHGTVMQKHLKSNFTQMKKSWYIMFFQLPWLPEIFAKRKNWSLPTRALIGTSLKGTFSNTDIAEYQKAWSQPGAYKAMLNWYRSIIQKPSVPPKSSRISVPALLIWGTLDPFLGREMAQPSIDLCDDGRLVLIEEATHWVHHEKSEQVNELILNFLSDGLNKKIKMTQAPESPT